MPIGLKSAGVGNWDEFARVGDWGIGRRPPMAPGVEAAGAVIAVGTRTNRWAPGDQVITHAVPVREQGSWSEQLVADDDLLAAKPEDVPWDEAAAFPLPALTAAPALREVTTTTANGMLLVNGAGGVTGGMVATLARVRGTRMIATAGPMSADRLKRLGGEAVYDYHDHDWPNAVRALSRGTGVLAAVNAAPRRRTRDPFRSGRRRPFATITGARPKPERGCRSPTFTFMPTAGSCGTSSCCWPNGSSKSLSALSTRSKAQRRRWRS